MKYLKSKKHLIVITTMLGIMVLTNPLIVKAISNNKDMKISKIATYNTGNINADGGTAEIVKYNKDNNKFYLINGANQTIDIVSLDNIQSKKHTDLNIEKSIDIKKIVNSNNFEYGDITSIDVNNKEEVVVVAVQEKDYSKNGKIVVLDYNGKLINTFNAGIQPDMIKMTTDGKYILTANEGEPRKGLENTVDPKGSITIVNYKNRKSQNIEFDNNKVIEKDVHIRNEKGGAIVDLEPEYIAINDKNNTAYVSLQENNAIATIDIKKGKIKSVKSLGFKDHSIKSNGLDAAKDNNIDIEPLPILGSYMPDGITYVNIEGEDYIITANEGDGTEWEEFENVGKFKDIKKDIKLESSLFNGMSKEEAKIKFDDMKNSEKYDKLEVLTDLGNDAIYTLGARSFSIWKADSMELVFDSKNDFETIIAKQYPKYFNSSNNNTELDSRSGKKGPEPEDVKVGKIGDKIYAFIGIERMGGVMVYDITTPKDAKFVTYHNTRDFSEDIKGDVAPEGLDFIDAKNSKTGNPLVVIANEVSGTVSINEIEK